MFLLMAINILLCSSVTSAPRSSGNLGFMGLNRQQLPPGLLPKTAHFYDVRDWLGQDTSEVCSTMALFRDYVLVSTDSCPSQRFLSAIQRPILYVPSDISGDECEEQLSGYPSDNRIFLGLFGFNLEHFLVDLATNQFLGGNVFLIHVCESGSYCGRSVITAAVERLQEKQTTTLLCWVNIIVESDFIGQLVNCLDHVAYLAENERKIYFILDTQHRLIHSVITTLSAYSFLNVMSKIVLILPPNYPLTGSDFVGIKAHDNVFVTQWAGETWLNSITSRTSQRYLEFWGVNNQSQLAGTLATLSSTQYFSRMISSDKPYESLPEEICSVNSTSTKGYTEIMADLKNTFTCSDEANESLCSSYVVSQFELDPVDESPRQKVFGTWRPSAGLFKSNASEFNLDDLGGRLIRVVTFESPPFLVRNETAYALFDGENTTGLYQGIIPNMLETLSKVMNFKYVLVFPSSGDEFYGIEQPNGSWNGMIGMLQRREVDLIAADLTINPQRQKILDFTIPFFEDRMTVLLPRSEFVKSLFKFLQPFNTVVWICVIATVAASGLILYLFSRFSPYYEAKKRPNYFASLSESYMYCYGTMVSQGGQITPDADSSRIFMAFWWLFGICTLATYSGNLIAFLTFPGKLKFIDTFDDFISSNNIQPVIQRNTYTESALQKVNRPLYQAAWQKINENPESSVVSFYQEAIMKVQDYKFGFIGQLANMKSTIAKDSIDGGTCHFALLGQPLETVNYAFGFRKNTNYAVLFNKWIRRLTYSGLINYWAQQEWDGDHKPKRCQKQLETPADEIRRVQIDDVIGVYAFLAGGCTLGMLFFFFEKMSFLPKRMAKFFEKRRKNSAIDMSVIKLNNGATLKQV